MPQARVRSSFNVSFYDAIRGGMDIRPIGQVRRSAGIERQSEQALASAAGTITVMPIKTHKWAARIGKYDNDPIWREIFASIRENRRLLTEGAD